MTINYAGISRSGDPIYADKVLPLVRTPQRFFTERENRLQVIDLASGNEIEFLFRFDDPSSPVDGEIWFRSSP